MTFNGLAWIERTLVVAALVTLPWILSSFQLSLATDVLVFGLLVASLDLLVGYTGLVSIGHAAFFGAGAYVTALLGTRVDITSVFVTLPASLVAAGLVALLVGWFATGTRGVTFIMLTLAFAEILVVVAVTWRSVTNGDDGISGVPLPTVPGLDLADARAFYYYALFVLLLGYVILSRLVSSPFGRGLKGIKANDDRMASLGYWVRGYKLAAFVVAGAIAGMAGAVHAQNNAFVSPQLLGFTLSALVLVMQKIGGGSTLWGPVIGAAVVLFFRDEVSSRFVDQWEALLGLLFLFVMYFLPGGIASLITALHRPLSARGATVRGELAVTPKDDVAS